MAVGNLKWLKPERASEALSHGVSFGMPWEKGLYFSGQRFKIEGDGKSYPLDCREVAFWPVSDFLLNFDIRDGVRSTKL